MFKIKILFSFHSINIIAESQNIVMISIVLSLSYLLHKSIIFNCFLLKGFTQKECLHSSELIVERKESNVL